MGRSARMHEGRGGNVWSRKRVLSLDGLRGLGALMVFLLHVDIMVKPFGAGGGPSLFPGTASVMVFFILSGIVLSLVPFKHMGNGGYDWLGYYPRRVVRLCVPLFAAIALALPAGYVAWRLGSTSRSALAVAYDAGLTTAVHDILMQFDVLFNASDGVNNLFGAQLVRVDSPVWSMSWELWFSLTLPLAIWCISRIRRAGLAVVATFIAVLVSHWSGYFPLRFCLMFWLGVMVAKRFDKIKAAKIPVPAELALLVASVGVIELSLVWHPGGVLEAIKSTAMNAACLVVVVVAIADGFTRRALSAAPMVFLGKVSYSLYLTHAIVIGALAALLPRLGIVDPLAIAAVSLPASMLVAVAFWRIIEVPSMNLSRSLASSGPGDAVR